METSTHQSQYQSLGDAEVLGLALASGNLTDDGRQHLADELAARGLLPPVVTALKEADPNWTPERRSQLVENTRTRRCPLCGSTHAALEAKEVNKNHQALLAMLGSIAIAALVQEPNDAHFTVVACPSCLGRDPASAGGPASEALVDFVAAHRHLLEAFGDRPDLVDAVLARNHELLSARLAGEMDPQWALAPAGAAASNKMVVVDELALRSEAIETMQLLNAANLEANVQEELREGETVFEVLVPEVHADLAKACIEAAEAEDEAGAFCFHCGSAVDADAKRCPDCDGDLSDENDPDPVDATSA